MSRGRVSAKDMVPKLKEAGNAKLIGALSKNLNGVIEAMIDAAKGYAVEKMVNVYKNGRNTGFKEQKVYMKEPDTAVGQYLLNHIAGKPKETVEHKGRVSLTMDDE